MGLQVFVLIDYFYAATVEFGRLGYRYLRGHSGQRLRAGNATTTPC
jgi:hypothetical protein